MKKIRSFAAIITAVLMLAAGSCSVTKTGYVYYLNYKPEADTALQEIAKHYTELTGVPVKVVTAASGSYMSTLNAQMNKSAPPTLFVLNSFRSTEDWDGYCHDLRNSRICEYIENFDRCIYGENGELRAIGYCYEVFGIIVNKTLLRKAGYDVSDIRSFDTLKSVAEDIHSRSAELGFDAFTSSGLESSSSWRFSAHLATVPLYYEFRDDGVAGQPPAITGKYLDLYRNIWDLYISNATVPKSEITTATGNMAEEEFGSGKAVFYQNGSWEYKTLTNKTGYAMDPESLTMIPIYCGMAGEENAGLCCGTDNYWVVNDRAGQTNIDATIDFLCWLVSSDEGKNMMSSSFGVTPFKDHIETDNVFFKAADEYEKNGNYNIEWRFSDTPNESAWRSGLVSALAGYSCGKGDWSKVSHAFTDGWKYQYKLEKCILD